MCGESSFYTVDNFLWKCLFEGLSGKAMTPKHKSRLNTDVDRTQKHMPRPCPSKNIGYTW